jgi:hypothetical protein
MYRSFYEANSDAFAMSTPFMNTADTLTQTTLSLWWEGDYCALKPVPTIPVEWLLPDDAGDHSSEHGSDHSSEHGSEQCVPIEEPPDTVKEQRAPRKTMRRELSHGENARRVAQRHRFSMLHDGALATLGKAKKPHIARIG